MYDKKNGLGVLEIKGGGTLFGQVLSRVILEFSVSRVPNVNLYIIRLYKFLDKFAMDNNPINLMNGPAGQ